MINITLEMNNSRGVEIFYDKVKNTLKNTEFKGLNEAEITELMRPIEVAYLLAKMKHNGQKRRDKKRYFSHIQDVSEISLRELPNPTIRRILISILHDIVEDSDITIEMIAILFGPDIARGVDLLTKKNIGYYLPDGEEKEQVESMTIEEMNQYYTKNKKRLKPIKNRGYYSELFDPENEDKDAIGAKIADRTHNLRSMIGASTLEQIIDYIEETENFIITGIKKLPQNPLYSIGINKLEAQLANLKIYLQSSETSSDIYSTLS